MNPFLALSEKDRLETFRQVAAITGLPVQAIEKDWWVTLVLRAVFASTDATHFAFKGGTSLSKCWGLIERFSEDIDLAIDRAKWGHGDDITSAQITKVRKQSRTFLVNEFVPELTEILNSWGASSLIGNVAVIPDENSDKDPVQIELVYKSLVEPLAHLKDGVLIEVSVRSLKEPVGIRAVTSMVSAAYPEMPFTEASFDVTAVLPVRTFLEKAFLLHEVFTDEHKPDKAERKSRHLYDLVQLMDTKHGKEALSEDVLFHIIRKHRSHFSRMKHVDYDALSPQTILILPPDEVKGFWEDDYRALIGAMVYGARPGYNDLLARLQELQNRFRGLITKTEHDQQLEG